ncbi:phosphotransferase [Pontibacter sp. G13]|uniref:RapZ C-terminal domain-containing protein n=1 Tax=Pontibacter sp. G13 TaxID=3074898 RepID=UPI00288AAC9D|nr:RNase adapter RapZ [Pontibacter sp. G13]WNJ15912.1 RNase adapter RapZ [Pontibacter sp. G13]
MNKEKEKHLTALYTQWSGESEVRIEPLPPSGSYREYYRLRGDQGTAIGVFNADDKENRAFISFTKHFLKKGLPVPKIYGEDLDNRVYLLQDLGDKTLFSLLMEQRTNGAFPHSVLANYKMALDELVKLQVQAGKDLDYSVCYPRDSFDQQSMMWDLNYFKYYFLKLSKVPFDEQLLENDFQTYVDYLQAADRSFFLYRDFQARNIMVHEGHAYFIDYQGGRRGALQYDLASLLFQAKANIPHEIRDELLDYYIHQASQHIDIDRAEFIQFYYGYVMLRLMQVLGAYGFRGFYERKPHFLESIPFALDNLKWLLDKMDLPIEVPELMNVARYLADSESLRKHYVAKPENQELTVTVNSFSYKQGIPEDPSGNGGGYVFDCRAIHNPGRYAPYKKLTGRDEPVIQFLRSQSTIEEFLTNVYSMVDASVDMYLERNFSHLMVSFGCTGGQHRSVYSADSLARHLKKKFGVNVVVNHVEQERKNWIN